MAKTEKTLEEMVAEHNELAKGLGMPPVNKWNGKREKLQERIDALLAKVEDAKAPAKGKRGKVAKGDKEARITVVSIVKPLLEAGKTNDECLAAVAAALPNAKTTVGCIRWYRNHFKIPAPKAAVEAPAADAKGKKGKGAAAASA